MKRVALPLMLLAGLCSCGLAQESRSDTKAWDEKYEQLLEERPEIRKKVESGQATKEQVIEWLKKGGDRRQAKGKYYAARIALADPTRFSRPQENVVYSGPQPGEKLRSFKATGLRGALKGQVHDPVASAGGKPLVLIFQDNSVVGQKGLLLCGGALARIADKSPRGLHVSTTFLVDDPTPDLIFEYDFMDQIDPVVNLSVSPDRRDGPGAYGLNREVAMTIIVAKDSKVLYNFALTQPMLYPDPHVFGAIAEAIGERRETVESWLAEGPAEGNTAKGGK